MRILTYIEVRDGRPTADSLGLLSRATAIGDVDAIVCGHDVRELASVIARYGAINIAMTEDRSVTDPLPQAHTDAVVSFLSEQTYDAVFLGSSILAADVAGGLSARLEAGVNSDLTEVEVRDGRLIGFRPALGDSVVVEVAWTTALAIAVFRPGAFVPDDRASPEGTEPTILDVTVTSSPSSSLTSRVETSTRETTTTSLADASIIVAGGRGMGAQENLQLIRDLADALGGAPAVSMPLVSNGWAPYSMQVGQTGSMVRPKLYIACGISGQMQHKIGMERSGTIVAINTDASAPIFRFCDLAVVADAVDVLPKLIAIANESDLESSKQ